MMDPRKSQPPVLPKLDFDETDECPLPPSNPGEMRKSWVLAEITEKEYCQAKKPQNRFKVPVGTKFYRVKARPWNREAAIAAKRDVQAPLPQASAY